MSSSTQRKLCRLVGGGRTIFASEYDFCPTGRPMPEEKLNIVPPKDSADMWLFGENAEGVVVFTKNGDILLPVDALSKCPAVLARIQKVQK